MSKAVKSAGPDAPDLRFEQALQKLESIVESMEADDLPLESLLERFEEGTKLAQVCQSKLGEAELKIQRLEKATSGEILLKSATVAVESSQEEGN